MRFDDVLNFNSASEAYLEAIDHTIEMHRRKIERLELLRHAISQIAATDGAPSHADDAAARIARAAQSIGGGDDDDIPSFLRQQHIAQEAERRIPRVVPPAHAGESG